jgi:hypothetical protein
MRPDEGCSSRLTQAEAWAAISNGDIVRWCFRCARFRRGECEIAFEEISAIRKTMFERMKAEGRWMRGKRITSKPFGNSGKETT